jgi:RNA polymerase sigma factor (sigma-70 family)
LLMDDTPPIDEQISACLERLASGDLAARETIFEICNARLQTMASRLLGDYPRIRRWDTTSDIAQNAAIRLHRALGDVVPSSPRGLMGLMALQIRRELLDLARKYSGPTSFAANQDTNARPLTGGGTEFLVERAADQETETISLDQWERFHGAVDALPDDLREVFCMAWYLGLDQTEVARTLGCSPRTVGRRGLEARQRLQQAVGTDTA